MPPTKQKREPGRRVENLEEEFERLERKFLEAASELKTLRGAYRRKLEETEEDMRERWADVPRKVPAFVAAGISFFFVCSFYVWSVVGRANDLRALPHGSDVLLDRLPLVDLVPVLTVGWLVAHVLAIFVGVVYTPRRWAFLLGSLAMLIVVRTAFVALNPVGAPPGIITLNASYLLSPLRGVLAFENEFFFSGHTALPFLYALAFWRIGWARWSFLALSVVMAVSVLLTRNHYTMDVLGAYFITYSVYRLSRRLLGRLDPEREAGEP